MPSKIDDGLNVAIIGAGLGGLSAAVALRRQGHHVTVYERYDFANEVGASLSTASNGSKFLEQWGIDLKSAKPVILKKLINHEWSSGNVTKSYELGDYKARFGTVSAQYLDPQGLACDILTRSYRTTTTSIALTSTRLCLLLPLEKAARDQLVC